MISTDNDIIMVRGDTRVITVTALDNNGNQLLFKTGDKLYMTVKSTPTTTEKLFQKTITLFEVDGTAVITIDPADTRDLSYRDYLYDIQWIHDGGIINTLVPASRLYITEEITREEV